MNADAPVAANEDADEALVDERVLSGEATVAAETGSTVLDEPLQPGGTDRRERLLSTVQPDDEIVGRGSCLRNNFGRVAVAHLVFGELVLVKDVDGAIAQPHDIQIEVDSGYHVWLYRRLARHVDVDRDVGLAGAIPAGDPTSVGRDEDNEIMRLDVLEPAP